VDAARLPRFVRSSWLRWRCDGRFFFREAEVRGSAVVCARLKVATLWRRSLSGHLGSQRAVVRRGTAVASPAQFLVPFFWLLS
jgi:hypothetical protein